jgi:flagellar basal body-associated protein FliL
MDTVEAKEGDDETAKKRSLNIDLKNTLVMVVVAMISVGCAFLFVTRMYSFKDGYDGTNVVDASPADATAVDNTGTGKNGTSILDKILVPMDSIIVNLGNIDSRRYLRVVIALEVDDSETEKAIKEKNVIFRDKLISFLSKINTKDIGLQDGQFKLRTEIKDILNKEFFGSDNEITHVYFSDFVIQ